MDHSGTIVLGTHSAAIYMGGRVYYLMYSHWSRRNTRVTPVDAERVAWDTLEAVHSTAFGDDHIATEITLRFSREWRFIGELFHTRTVRLVLSTRSQTLRRICAERRLADQRRIEAAMPFAMGCHHRLGNASIVQLLDDNLARMVGSFL